MYGPTICVSCIVWECALPNPVKLAVFDCDGTIVDSQHSIMACMVAAFDGVGLRRPALADVRRVVGLPLAQAISVLAADERAPVSELVSQYSQAWSSMRGTDELDEPVFDGIVGVFDRLAADGWILGVATGKSMRGLVATLEKHNLSDRFVTLQTADHARGKPDPQMLELAMHETGAERHETIMIGDTTYDIEMACAAGVRPIGVAWGYHAKTELIDAGAVGVADTMLDLLRFCEVAEETSL